MMNDIKYHKAWTARIHYDKKYEIKGTNPSECIKCGKCEASCPQHLAIRDLLVEVAKEFE